MNNETQKEKIKEFEWYSTVYLEAYNHYAEYLPNNIDTGEVFREHAHEFALKTMELKKQEELHDELNYNFERMQRSYEK